MEDGDDDYFTTLVDSYSNIHNNNILAVAVDPGTGAIATSSTDRTVKLTDPNSGNERVYQHHQAPVLSIQFHPVTPHLMLTTSMDGTSVLVDTSKEGEIYQRFHDHQKYVVQGLFSSDGRYMATASYDRMISVYKQDADGRYQLAKQLGPFVGNVETICFLPEEAVLVAGVNNDNYLHYIHLDDAFRRERVNLNANSDDWVSFSPVWISPSPDGRHILCSTNHSSGRIILLATHQSKQVQNYYDVPTYNMFQTRRHCWHPSGRYFYASGGDNDNCIRVFETKTGRVAAELVGHKAMVRAMTIDPAVGLVTGGYDHTVNVWSKPPLPTIR